MVSRSTDTATANSVFGTGRTVMVGCRSEAHALLGAQMMCWLIHEKMGIVCSVFNFNVCNVCIQDKYAHTLWRSDTHSALLSFVVIRLLQEWNCRQYI